MEEKKKKKAEILFDIIGKYCLDISKLVFGGVILAGVMNLDVNSYILFGIGSIVVALTAAVGIVFISLSNSKK
jgi:hypothetical protein